MTKKICLFDLEQAGVIILENSGIHFFNNTGGKANIREEAEGTFAPLSNCLPLGLSHSERTNLCLTNQLRKITTQNPALAPSQVSDVNDVLREISSSDRYQVNLSRLAESKEAWVYVTIYPQGDYSHFEGYDTIEAVLTWPNNLLE